MMYKGKKAKFIEDEIESEDEAGFFADSFYF